MEIYGLVHLNTVDFGFSCPSDILLNNTKTLDKVSGSDSMAFNDDENKKKTKKFEEIKNS